MGGHHLASNSRLAGEPRMHATANIVPIAQMLILCADEFYPPAKDRVRRSTSLFHAIILNKIRNRTPCDINVDSLSILRIGGIQNTL